jgi:hypothetical protein
MLSALNMRTCPAGASCSQNHGWVMNLEKEAGSWNAKSFRSPSGRSFKCKYPASTWRANTPESGQVFLLSGDVNM